MKIPLVNNNPLCIIDKEQKYRLSFFRNTMKYVFFFNYKNILLHLFGLFLNKWHSIHLLFYMHSQWNFIYGQLNKV